MRYRARGALSLAPSLGFIQEIPGRAARDYITYAGDRFLCRLRESHSAQRETCPL